MKTMIALMCLMAAPAVASAPGDVDLTGSWTLNGEVAGTSVVEHCTLAQKDTALTGSCTTDTGKYDTTGKTDGKTATFKHGGNYQGTDLIITFTGKVAADGTMSGTMDVDPFNVTGSFTAKKSTEASTQ